MPLDSMIQRQITGIRAFDQLPIDQKVWREAHNHHHKHRMLHAVSAHRPGIVYGLEVVASSSNPQQVIVAPGVAIDSEGQTILVTSPVPLTISESSIMPYYITLQYLSTVDPRSAIEISGVGTERYRQVEGRILEPSTELPQKPFLELARIERKDAAAPIKDAVNRLEPGDNQINLMFRQYAFPHCYADIGVGELSYVGVQNTDAGAWRPHRGGLWNLLHEGNGRGFHLTFTGPFRARAQASGSQAPGVIRPGLLYMAGNQSFNMPSPQDIDGLRRFLVDEGGTLLGEAVGGSAEFKQSFEQMSGLLGASLQPIGKGSPLLTAHYVFAVPPPGGRSGALQADMKTGVIFSTADYGSAWQGDLERPEAPDARERIRQSVEFGLNIVAFAAYRRRLAYLNTLSGS